MCKGNKGKSHLLKIKANNEIPLSEYYNPKETSFLFKNKTKVDVTDIAVLFFWDWKKKKKSYQEKGYFIKIIISELLYKWEHRTELFCSYSNVMQKQRIKQ